MTQTELNKQLNLIAKAFAKQEGWKSINGTPYWSIGALFFNLVLSASAKEGTFHCSLRFKWVELDNKLWHVLGMSSNENESLSLHVNGAFVLTGQELLSISKRSLDWLPGVLEQQIDNAVAQARTESMNVAKEVVGLDGYLDFIRRRHNLFIEKHPRALVNLWKEHLLAALVVDDLVNAERIVKERILANDHGGFSVGGKSFYERALVFCTMRQPTFSIDVKQ